ncbi:MAG: hypothetical protein HOM34_02065 [Planctomycetes bacterium]|jgi:hypothetical protein|nr:hypothetical protein [Planctomycetota bacterium]MBT4028910.1 hypothetical protein [Planctomycetota bacterium]MBT4561253.1 hypothetical protein [Planctomycetota bacterium]MBT5101243.1 hypothetical protein [Planctomycetota bacterium]MBT5119488.1 hypothetical protein [Planctomycetota bacterium]
MKHILPLILLGAFFYSAPIFAQQVDEPGPHAVGWRDISFRDSHYGRGRVEGRIYYPAVSHGENQVADPSQGPFPLTGFMHGYIEPASDYDELCTHIASWGFVVMSNDTETGLLFVSMQSEAKDTRALMQWVEDQSQSSSSWLDGMTDNHPWSASGHSMGGGALSYLVNYESRVRTIVMLEPYQGSLLGGSSNGFNAFQSYDGNALIIGADEDLTNNYNSVVRPWFEQADNSRRRVWALLHGGDHFGSTDADIHALWGFGSLDGDEQHLAHRRLVLGFLLAEIKGEQNCYYDFTQTQHISLEGDTKAPPLWSFIDPSNSAQLILGSFGTPAWRLRIAGSMSTGSLNTIYGELGLDQSSMQIARDHVLGSSGWDEINVPIQPSWSGLTLYFQALSNHGTNGALSEITEVTIP